MARTPKSPDAGQLPTKAEILALIAETPGKVGKRDLARSLGLNSAGRIALKRVLKDLQSEGLVEKKRKALHKADALPPVIVADIIKRDADGEFICVPAQWDDARGNPPLILLDTPRGARQAGPAPGLGDKVLIRLAELHEDDGPAYSGRLIKLLSAPEKRIIGIFRSLPDGSGRMIPIDKKAQGREILIPAGAATGEAKDGDLISVEAGREGRLGLAVGRVRDRLGSTTSEKAVSLIAIHMHEIPHVFPDLVLREAELAKEPTLKGREDWRDIPLITIDPADAKDHDDAVHAEADPDPANAGGFILHIAIADVAAYIRPGTALDQEAENRGNSVYFPDRVVPMLPERISNELCSLKPGVNRAAMALRAVIDADGNKISHSFHRVLMRSAAKLSYQMAQEGFEGRVDDLTGPIKATILDPLMGAYRALAKARDARQPLDLELPERKLVLNADGEVADVIIPPRLDAHRLIEEFMILANVAAAETLEKARALLLYRVHDNPSLEKMQGLRDFLETVGISLPKQGNVRPELFNRILHRVKDSANAPLVNEIVLRSQAQAEYSPDNQGHFGLNLRRYAHFTSPIRRYADLIVHRSLIRLLGLGEDGLPDGTFDGMRALGQAISGAERRAMKAERETIDRLIAQYLADQIGASFAGRITGVTRSGLFLRLDRTGADGFIPISTLGDERFHHDERAHALIGGRTGESFRLGDTVKVRLVEALPVAGALRFEMLSQGRYVKISRGKSGLRGRDDHVSKRNTFDKPNVNSSPRGHSGKKTRNSR